MTNYTPFIRKIDDVPNILDKNNDLINAEYSNLPLLSLGFHSFINQVREKMNDDQLRERLFYLVVNKFEHKINEHDDDLEQKSEKYFNSSTDIERSFYKLWEIIFYFNLIPLDQTNFLSVSLAEKDGSFLRAILEYRNKFGKASDVKKDHYCLITKSNDSKSDNIISECITKWNSSIFKYKSKANELNDETNDDADLTNANTIKNFIKFVIKNKKNANLITCNGDVNTNNEVDIYKILLGEIITSINIQAKGGNLVIKLFDTFTKPTLKLICLLKSLYSEVFVCKPLMSRNFKQEKFLVCKDFKFSQDSALKSISNKLFDLLDKANKAKNIYDFFSGYQLEDNFLKTILDINIKTSNSQYVAINDIIKYKNEGNYYGDFYHKFKNEQINATNWWSNTFYPKNEIELIKNQKLFILQ